MTKQLKKQIENQSQSGRSMIEMLGVLAIIAILSIGGIVGYKLAMNYYQADQIANEINLMRNDLKVKYALGNEELLLGDPYDDTPADENYSGHLSTQYDRYPVDYDCIIRGNKDSKNELYNCREADAYYIAVGNISKGVCKPLTTLVAAMDGRLEMDINGTPYTGGDLCTSDEANEIYVEFDAEDVNGNYDSNRPEGWCAKDEDCPDEKPFCENKKCVECTPETGCESNTQHCENNECISCPEGKIWSGTACVDCMTDTDCADPDTPICKTDEHICVECKTNEDCFEKDTENPVCNTTEGKCEPCPAGESWKESAQGCAAYECRTNEDCNPEGGFENYCYFNGRKENKPNSEEWQNDDPQGAFYGGECHQVSADLTKKATIRNIPFYGSEPRMTWWSACRICAAFNEESDSNCRAPTEFEPDFMATWTDIDWQCYSGDEEVPVPNPLQKKQGECRKHEGPRGNGNYPDVLREFDTMFGSSGYYFWFNNSWDNRIVYTMEFRSGNVSQDRRDNSWFSNGNALCKKIHKN